GGVQDLGRLGHEVDAAEDDRVGLHAGRLARELERVAHEVGHREDLRALVVVRQDDGVAGALQGADLGDDVGQRGAAFGAVVPIAERREQRFELVPRGGEGGGGGGGGGHGGSRVGVRVSRTHTRALPALSTR